MNDAESLRIILCGPPLSETAPMNPVLLSKNSLGV